MSTTERGAPEWDDFDRALLSSAELDRPAHGAMERATRALSAATLASAALVSASTSLGASGAAAGATLVGVSLAALGKALLVGAVVGVGFLGAVNLGLSPQPEAPRTTSSLDGVLNAGESSGVQRARVPTPLPAEVAAAAGTVSPEAPARVEAVPARGAAAKLATFPRERGVPAAQAALPAVGGATSLSVEVELLDRARAALARKQPSAALAELERYERRAGGHSLSREASLLRIEALRAVGEAASAAEIAKRLVDEDPQGLTAHRARELMR